MYFSARKREQKRQEALETDNPDLLRKTYSVKEIDTWRNEERDTLLCLSIINEAPRCAKDLMMHGADPLTMGHCGETAFSYAMRHDTAKDYFEILNASEALPKATPRQLRYFCHLAIDPKSRCDMRNLFEYGLPAHKDVISTAFDVAMSTQKTDVMSDVLAIAKIHKLPVVTDENLAFRCTENYKDAHHPVRQWLFQNMPEELAHIGLMPKNKTEIAEQILTAKPKMQGPKLGVGFNNGATVSQLPAKHSAVVKQSKVPVLKLKK